MRFLAAALLAVAPGAVVTETIKITATSDLTFDPSTVDAKEGDVLEFHFQPNNHSVAMGEFGSINGACVPSNVGGFFSGYMPTTSGENDNVFRVTVNNTDAMVYYCTLGDHCAQGMIGVVNASPDMLAEYKQNASAVAKSVAPRQAFGGEITTADAPADDSSSNSGTYGGGGGGGGSGNAAGTVKATIGSAAFALAIALMMI